MSTLDWEYVEFWIIAVCGVLSLIVYQIQATGWTVTRAWFTLFNLVIAGWSVIGLTSRIHVTDVKHWAFFAAVDLIAISELVMVSYLARTELLRRRQAGRHRVSVDKVELP